MEVIRTTALTKTYASKNAVDNLEMIIPQGAVYGLIGRNGAGKSTTQKMICGLANPTSGEIKLFGKPVNDETSRRKIGVLIENAGLYPGLSAHENMFLQGLCIGITDIENKISKNLELVGMANTGKKKAKHFSTGMKQRLGIAMALLGDPELLVLDEPINGLDPEGIREFRQIITQLNKERGMTILISSHILGELSKISTHYGIIKEGKMVQQISVEELSKNCPDYLCIKVNNAQEAAEILKQATKMELGEYKVPLADELRLYDVKDSGTVMQTLSAKGFTIREVFLKQFDLEEYFLDFMGGSDNA